MTIVQPGGAGMYDRNAASAPAPATRAAPAKPRKKAAAKAPTKPAAKKGDFLLQKAGRKKNTQAKNPRKDKSFVVVPHKGKPGFVDHVYNVNGKKVVETVPKKGAKAGTATSNKGGRTYKRKPKGASGGGQFS